jgi:hypothetical protein
MSLRTLLLLSVMILAGLHLAGRILYPPYHDSLTIVTLKNTPIIKETPQPAPSHQSIVSVEANKQHLIYQGDLHPREMHNPVLWMAPFFDGSGFGREASTLFLSLSR